MARYRIDAMGGLARQLEFAPTAQRRAQMESAEGLLGELEATRAYPLEFVVYRITGFAPRKLAGDAQLLVGSAELLTGLALQHDLGLLVEEISDTLDLTVAESPEPVLTIDDVAERFNVTSKTIQRWRRRGLPARRFVFPDGKRRVGFVVRSVERFVAGHREEVDRGTNFSQISDREREEILRRARRLAVLCHCCANEIARRIARRLNRSPLTILHTIKRHDASSPDEAIFPLAPAPIAADDRGRIVRGYRKGLPLRVLARRVCRNRPAVYRVIVEERLARLTERKVRFHDDPLYHQPDAEAALAEMNRGESIAERREREEPAPRGMPPAIAAMCRAPLLSRGGERAMFLLLNYRKYQFEMARRSVDPMTARARDVERLERLLKRINDVKGQVVAANLRLVVSVARRHLRPGTDLMELVSDGTITLMRAADGFDPHKGTRFSTYATLALMKGFARSVPEARAKARRTAARGEATLDRLVDAREVQPAEAVGRRELVARLLGILDPAERAVIGRRFGLEANAAPVTAADRRLEQSALAKLRAAAGETADA